MDDNNKNEMEQIQRGLEAFLEKEIDGAGDPGSGRREPGPPESPEVLEFPERAAGCPGHRGALEQGPRPERVGIPGG